MAPYLNYLVYSVDLHIYFYVNVYCFCCYCGYAVQLETSMMMHPDLFRIDLVIRNLLCFMSFITFFSIFED